MQGSWNVFPKRCQKHRLQRACSVLPSSVPPLLVFSRKIFYELPIFQHSSASSVQFCKLYIGSIKENCLCFSVIWFVFVDCVQMWKKFLTFDLYWNQPWCLATPSLRCWEKDLVSCSVKMCNNYVGQFKFSSHLLISYWYWYNIDII